MSQEHPVQYAWQLLHFQQAAPTAFHTVAEAERLLQGFTRLREQERWQLQPGGRYYLTRNGSALIAFVLPEDEPVGYQLVAAHNDSPCLKLKEVPELQAAEHYVQLNVEPYGGAILSTWMDRPLSVAGRVLVRTAEGICSRLVNLDRDMCVIPNVAIHMNRAMNDGYKIQPQLDLNPMWGSEQAAGSLRWQVAEAAGAEEKDILGSDLYLYNRMPGCVWGVEQAYLSAARLDDLECAWTALQALLRSPAAGHVNVCCLFDNEEVGSATRQGADSAFLGDTLARISLALGKDAQAHQLMLASSFLLSADNAHAVHPNHPEFSDPQNRAWMNGGVVLKFNASQRYITDGLSAALFHALCEDAGVPVQHYANRSDMRGGSTLGHLSLSHVSIPSADIGLAQLAMHSAWETAGTMDLDWMIQALSAFYRRGLRAVDDGRLLIGG